MDENLEEPKEKEMEKEKNEPEKAEVKEERSEPEEEVKQPVLDKKKEGSFKPIIFVMIVSLVLAMFWDKVPFIRDSVHGVLNPTVGGLLNWNLTLGMMIIVFIISLFTTLVQKYATDQEAIKELRKEQKILQEEMKKYKEHPEKIAELSKKQLEFIPRTFKLTSRSIMFTGIPFILFFRWFQDFFTALGDTKFFGFLSWFWFYLIFIMIFSTILRKALKVV